jgi:predicted 3-demethylubiquinone-9 3-methyltransferase (glyoxalase superfamily)
MTILRTCLWFEKDAVAAAEFYVGLLPNSRIDSVEGSVEAGFRVVHLTLAGVPYMLLEAGTRFPQSEAVSISVLTADQAETDRLWVALTADGGQESMCGWLKDRWGLSWQITPEALVRLQKGPRGHAVFRAMLTMRKIDIAALEAAAAG